MNTLVDEIAAAAAAEDGLIRYDQFVKLMKK